MINTFSKKQIFFRVLVLVAILWAFHSKADFEFEENRSLPIVYVNVVIDSGSAHDPKTKLGLAHIANHMMLRGTKNLSYVQFNEKLNSLGASIWLDIKNEGTIFRAAFLSENLEKGLALLEETLVSPRFEPIEFRKLIKETESEILEDKGNDKKLVAEHFNRFFYGNQGYGNPLRGTIRGIKNITLDDVKSYYAQNLGKSVHVFGSGAASSSVIKSWHEKLSNELALLHPDAKVDTLEKVAIKKGTKEILIVDKPGATQSQVLIGGIGIRPELEGFYAVMLGNHVFGGHSFQARLMQEIRIKRGWTYGASNNFKFGKQPRHFVMYYFPKTSDTVPAIKLSLEMIEDFVKKGISLGEFESAKRSLVNNAPFNYDTAKKRIENRTEEHLSALPIGFQKDFGNNISKVDPTEVLPALQRAFDLSTLRIVIVGDAVKLKSELSQLKGFEKPEVVHYLE